jgi:hypothetical protein
VEQACLRYADLFGRVSHAERMRESLSVAFGGLLDVNGVSTSGRNQAQAGVVEIASVSGSGG